MIDDENRKILKQYHKLSDRHILVIETDMSYSDVLKVVALSDKIRKAGNELVGLLERIMFSSFVQKDIANYFFYMVIRKIRKRKKNMLIS